ncbi:MAG: NERD domain-containing protein [Xanthomonadaceae bacterium]|nr:NERD domain-containing protein [Xanthomonadaceae bacterium]
MLIFKLALVAAAVVIPFAVTAALAAAFAALARLRPRASPLAHPAPAAGDCRRRQLARLERQAWMWLAPTLIGAALLALLWLWLRGTQARTDVMASARDLLPLGVAVLLLALGLAGIGRVAALRRRLQHALTAELITAQSLHELARRDCVVLHDVAGQGGARIDHVVVAPSAVYAVATGSRLLARPGGSAEVRYDGERLAFPVWQEVQPLRDARAQAQWLARWLAGEVGAVPVVPVLALPGWKVRDAAPVGAVRVINPRDCGFMAEPPAAPLPAELRARVAAALASRVA